MAAECSQCDQLATQSVEFITGTSDPSKDHYGIRVKMLLCGDHLAELVRTTDRRYVIVPLSNPRRSKAVTGEQMAWDL